MPIGPGIGTLAGGIFSSWRAMVFSSLPMVGYLYVLIYAH